MATKKPKTIGRLLIIGGAEDPDEDDMKVLPHFVKMCGGKRARIIVCGSPSVEPAKKERTYKRLFEKLGAGEVIDANVFERPDGDNKELLAATKRATGVFFTGGDQLRLTALVAGTQFGECVRHRLWNEGLVVGGTSAGAAAMSSTMMIGGRKEGTVRRADVDLAPGLGYLRDCTIDTHFAQRGRLTRLLTVFSDNPQVLGIGIDENTAVEVQPGKGFTVVGSGAVFVFDGKVTHSNAPDVSDDEVLAVTDVIVHVLPEGYGFDLDEMRPITNKGKKIPKRSPG
ncbi:MAG TPA: cyanophycinase [Thermoanaerobaculia bacterium]|nr:cyanophycinase [Thermoanaerobaculia bacterium]